MVRRPGCLNLYTKEVTRTRTSYDYVQSQTNGTVGGDPFSSSTTYQVPRSESITYNPYSFVVYFNAEGNVDHVEDLISSDASWQRK